MKVSRSEPGFVVSSAVHAGLLLAAFVVFSQPAKFEDAIETPVEVITDAEFTQTPKGEKTAHEKTPKPRVDKVEKDSGIKPNLPLNEAKKDTPAPLPPLRRTAEPGEDDAPRIPPKRVAALAPEPKAEPTKVEPKPAPKAEAKPEPKPEEKHEAKHAPQPAKPKSAAPEKHEDEPKEAEVIKPKPLKLERPDQAMPAPAKDEMKELIREASKETPKPAPKALDRDAVKKLLQDAARDPAREDAKETPKAEKPNADARLKADEVAKLLASRKLADKPSEGEIADRAEKGVKPKSGDEAAPKSKFDAADISKMLSRETPQRRAATGEKARVASLGADAGAAPKLSASMEARIAAYIHDHYHPCWASALSLGGATFAPVVEFHLSREGALQGAPRLVNGSSDPVEHARGEQAVQAVRRCSPMRIPPEFAPYYEEALRDVTIRFQDAN